MGHTLQLMDRWPSQWPDIPESEKDAAEALIGLNLDSEVRNGSLNSVRNRHYLSIQSNWLLKYQDLGTVVSYRGITDNQFQKQRRSGERSSQAPLLNVMPVNSSFFARARKAALHICVLNLTH